MATQMAFLPRRDLIRKRATGSDQEDQMAAERDVQGDIQAHVKSYSAFAGMMKWSTIVAFIVAAIVVLLIAS